MFFDVGYPLEDTYMDWNHELLASTIWLGKAFGISLIGLTITFWILGKSTKWGRQFMRISGGYFKPSRSIKPLFVLSVIILLTLVAVKLNVLYSFWFNGMYTALQNLDSKRFWFMMIVFTIIAAVLVVRYLLAYYIRQAFIIHWRVWLTNTLIDRWLDKQSYYRSQHVELKSDNPDQRIQQDVDNFTANSIALSMGMLNSIVSLFEFTIILWGLSGILAIFGFSIPRGVVFMVYIYVIIATVFAVWIGRPLVLLNFLNEKLTANFRYALIRLHEYGESIAFFLGESIERVTLFNRFSNVIKNAWAIIYRTLKLDAFNLTVSQTAAVFPFIVQAQRFFAKQITLGDMIQTAQAFGQVHDSLSFFRNTYETFAGYRAVLDRLTGFLDVIDAVDKLPAAQIQTSKEGLQIDSITIKTPSSITLVENLAVSLSANNALLIRGRSGVGKTTLLRALAGLWPYTSGTIIRPDDQETMFLPQKPYLPLGTLRTALFYPKDVQDGNSAAETLAKCQLSHLIPRLDEEDDWTSILSLGEQQRLAFGRALLSNPHVLFLDEASSSMDEGLEHSMYQLIRKELPNAILVSVGHRSSLLNFHNRELELLGEGKWRLADL